MISRKLLRRPLFAIGSVFFTCSILLTRLTILSKMILICILAAVCVAAAVIKIIRRRTSALSGTALILLITALVSALISVFCFDVRLADTKKYDGITESLTVTIDEVMYSSSYYGCYTARVSGDSVPEMKVYLTLSDGSCSEGDVLVGDVTLYSLESSVDESEKVRLLADRVFMSAEAESLTYVKHDDSFSLTRFFSGINRTLSTRLRSASSDRISLACAVLLGDRSHLEPSLTRDFGRLGISHLLAISGLHLSVIVIAAELILRKISLGRKLRTAITCAVIIFYMALVGFSPSVTRAGIMHLLRLFASVLDRKSDSFTSLAVAASLIVLVNPSSVYDVSLILSVLSAYACAAYAYNLKVRKSHKGILSKALASCADTFKLTLLICALTLPIMWSYFGEISLISPITNIIFIPLISVFLYASLIYSFTCGIPWISGVFTSVLISFEEFIASLAGRISSLRHITLSLSHRGIGFFVLLLFCTVMISTMLYKSRKRLCRVAVAVSVVCFAVFVAVSSINLARTYSLDFVSKGKSEGFVLRSGHSFVIVDSSDGSSGFLRHLSNTAKDSCATEADVLVLTHLHKKHVSSVRYLTESTVVRKVVLPSPANEDEAEICESIITVCAEEGVAVDMYDRSCGEVTDIGGVMLSHHDHTVISRSTHPVVSLGISIGEKDYVYLGGSSNEGCACIEDFAFNSDTAFLGVHPPIYKSYSELAVGGDAVFTRRASSEEYLTALTIGGTSHVMDEDGVYSIGPFRK